MALRFGYFDSDIIGVDDEGMPIFDRAETSDLFALLFASLVSDGVLAVPSTCFRVRATGNGLNLEVEPGFGMVKGHFAYNDEVMPLSIEAAPQTYSRIDRVILRCNYLERLVEILIKTGEEAANPVPPALIRPAAGDYFELCLADISLFAGQRVITQSSITDRRPDSSVCGYIVNLVGKLDTAEFFEQFQVFYAEFTERCRAALVQIQESGDARLSEIMAALSSTVATNGPWKNDISYQRYSIVSITDGEGTSAYVAINDVPVGIVPPNEAYWVPITLRGETGANGVVVPVDRHYCFQVIDGHLWLYYTDVSEPPNFQLDENGHLIYEIEG